MYVVNNLKSRYMCTFNIGGPWPIERNGTISANNYPFSLSSG